MSAKSKVWSRTIGVAMVMAACMHSFKIAQAEDFYQVQTAPPMSGIVVRGRHLSTDERVAADMQGLVGISKLYDIVDQGGAEVAFTSPVKLTFNFVSAPAWGSRVALYRFDGELWQKDDVQNQDVEISSSGRTGVSGTYSRTGPFAVFAERREPPVGGALMISAGETSTMLRSESRRESLGDWYVFSESSRAVHEFIVGEGVFSKLNKDLWELYVEKAEAPFSKRLRLKRRRDGVIVLEQEQYLRAGSWKMPFSASSIELPIQILSGDWVSYSHDGRPLHFMLNREGAEILNKKMIDWLSYARDLHTQKIKDQSAEVVRVDVGDRGLLKPSEMVADAHELIEVGGSRSMLIVMWARPRR